MTRLAYKHNLARILAVEHDNPHSILGIHKDGNDVVVRAFLPEAAEAAVIDLHNRANRYSMKKVCSDGFFEVVIPKRSIFAYDLHLVTFKGLHTITRDPYSFLPSIGEIDTYLFNEGTHLDAHKKLGAHKVNIDGVSGTRFGVWAPNAKSVSVIGNFCDWDGRRYQMRKIGVSGIWEIFIPGITKYDIYKFEIKAQNGDLIKKADPFAFASQLRPESASVVWDITEYAWEDKEWIANRPNLDLLNRPMSVYEVHLGSWSKADEGGGWISYCELAPLLVEHCRQQNYTHLELMPIGEFPYDPSWGYQVTGYFCPTSRFGDPDDFKYFIDFMHQNEIGVIIDWVPGHFPKDEHGLSRFDGTALYEHEDSRKGEHKEWGTRVFNYGRTEVSNFLLSSALFWFEHYHVDGLRVDAVSSMLYLDYSREEGEWLPNVFNGRENLEAVEFLKRMNILIHDKFPGVITIAEESTSWPGVSRPTHSNGLGFTMKWNMGWMHDILGYFRKDPVYRKYHHGVLTFSLLYAFDENFILTLSHDEVVHGKGSLFDKMPGDLWQKFANLRLLYGYMFAHPGKKMLFQGLDIGQKEEWNFDGSVEWSLLENQSNAKLHRYMSDLGRLYLDSPSLWESDFTVDGFEWIDHSDTENSVISFMRKGKKLGDYMIFIFNFTPTPRENYLVGSPELGRYIEVFNSDSESYNGSNMGNMGVVQAYEGKRGKWKFHFSVTLPPLSVIAMKPLY